MFAISILANLIEIRGFFRERRERKREQAEREAQQRRLEVYEYLFDAAEKNIRTEEELATLTEKVQSRKSTIPVLEQRIETLRQAATREIVSQNIERTVASIRTSFAQLNKLRDDNADVEDLPNLPQKERDAIEKEISRSTTLPYELPQAIGFRTLLIALVVLFLPTPIDSIVVVILLRFFLRTFFDASMLSDQPRVTAWLFKHRESIGCFSCIGAWWVMFSRLQVFAYLPIEIITARLQLPGIEYAPAHRFSSSTVVFGVLLIAALVAGFCHWRLIRRHVLSFEPPQHITKTESARPNKDA